MDLACLVWQEDDCEEVGSCWIYDNKLLWNAMFILRNKKSFASLLRWFFNSAIAMKGINIFCFFLAGYYYKDSNLKNFKKAIIFKDKFEIWLTLKSQKLAAENRKSSTR